MVLVGKPVGATRAVRASDGRVGPAGSSGFGEMLPIYWGSREREREREPRIQVVEMTKEPTSTQSVALQVTIYQGTAFKGRCAPFGPPRARASSNPPPKPPDDRLPTWRSRTKKQKNNIVHLLLKTGLRRGGLYSRSRNNLCSHAPLKIRPGGF